MRRPVLPRSFLAAVVAVMGAAGSPPGPTPGAPADVYRSEIEQWRARRLDRLRSEGGWLTLVGLFWLEQGRNAVGADPGNRVALPSGKARPFLGSLDRAGDTVTFHAAPGSGVLSEGKPATAVSMRSDADGDPTVLTAGSLSFYVIRRGDRLGVRVKDSESAARRNFHGIEAFPIDPAWRVEARYEPYDPPKSISVPNVLGTVDSESCPGALVFELRGKTYRLDPVLEQGETDLFIIFGDQTNGRETYGAGRFLYASPPVNGHTVLDFNKAYNPPCVFTPYATCPLPPAQNKLPVSVEAGERSYAHGAKAGSAP
ncbi:MAG TPA: DUF1684 domain-containing protein [Thermoanaerobaculia bacterium]|nr:DUF1684 domain-containing protein [Thermoanaerobaculia bacterium]